jgi:ABC-type antimicrobial peptide transport system permease subunit
MGAVLGLPAGKLLLNYVMSHVKIDMLWIESIAGPMSYLLSFVMTMLSAVVVDFIFHFVLDKINMAEALKSVE